MSDVAIVIVNWNAGAHLVRAVASAFADPFGGEREVIVVDNASSDDSLALLAASPRRATVLHMGENAGFARACNAGVRATRGRYALLLNPDAELQPGALAALVALADQQPDTAILGGSTLLPDGTVDPASRRNVPTPAIAFARLFRVPGLARRLGVAPYNVILADDQPAAPVEAVSGSFMLVRRAAFDALGGFDERFFLYAEDLDLCLRARAGGWTVRSTAHATALHHKHVSAAQAPYRALWHFYRTMILFHRKHYAAARSPLTNAAVYAGVAMVFAARIVEVAVCRPGARVRLATARAADATPRASGALPTAASSTPERRGA